MTTARTRSTVSSLIVFLLGDPGSLLRSGRDVQRRDPVAGQGEAPPQVCGPTGEVALNATRDEVLVLIGGMGAEHFSRVLVQRCPALLGGPNLAGASPTTGLRRPRRHRKQGNHVVDGTRPHSTGARTDVITSRSVQMHRRVPAAPGSAKRR